MGSIVAFFSSLACSLVLSHMGWETWEIIAVSVSVGVTLSTISRSINK